MLKPILMGSAACAEIADRTATAKTDAAAKSERTRNARNMNVLPVLLLLLSLDRNTNSHEFDRSFATQSSRLSSRTAGASQPSGISSTPVVLFFLRLGYLGPGSRRCRGSPGMTAEVVATRMRWPMRCGKEWSMGHHGSDVGSVGRRERQWSTRRRA